MNFKTFARGEISVLSRFGKINFCGNAPISALSFPGWSPCLQIISSGGILLGRGLPAATAAQTHATFELFSDAEGAKHGLIFPGDENYPKLY